MEGEVEVEIEVQVEDQVDVEPQVQLDDEGEVEVEVQVQEKAGGVGDMEVVVSVWMIFILGLTKIMMMWGLKKVMRIMLGMRKIMMIAATVVKFQIVIFEENSDWTAWLESATFSQSTEATFEVKKF